MTFLLIHVRLFLECVFGNGLYARGCSKKIRAVFKAKGNSGKPLATRPPYGYKKSEFDKDVWVVDDEAAAVVRKIFQMCIEGYGPSQIARKLSEQQVLIPTAYFQSKGQSTPHTYKKPYRWCEHTIAKILESMEYAGHTINFKSQIKSYKCKKRINHAKEDWVVFENTHELIVSQHDFDLVQELRKNKRKIQKCGEINPFSGIVYCADCGSKMYLCRSASLTGKQEHLKCSSYAKDKDECSAHFIRTEVLRTIVIAELNKLLETVHNNEDEQAELKAKISELSAAIEIKEQKSADTSQFLEIVRKYTEITELTPEIMHELLEKIVVHSPDKSSGHRVQQIDIYYRFNIAVSTAIADRREYDKK